MGLLEILTGKRRLAAPATDRLFAMSTAYVSMETGLAIVSRGSAAIVFQPLATVDFTAIVKEAEDVVRATAADSATTIETFDDSFGYRWLVARGAEFESLVTGLNALSVAVQDGGYGERLLCAAFAFQDTAGHPLYWIYNYKRGTFYPFVPAAGEEQRDNEHELVLKAQMTNELPVEPELSRWFPLWGIPI